MRIGYLHIGPPTSGVCRYGRLLAAEARRRSGVTVVAADLSATCGQSIDGGGVRNAARQVAQADVVHAQYNRLLWGGTWRQGTLLRVLLRACTAPLVVTLHDVYPFCGLAGVLRHSTPRLFHVAHRIGSRFAPPPPAAAPNRPTPPVSNRILGWRYGPTARAVGMLTARAARTLVCTETEKRRLTSLLADRAIAVVPHFVEPRSDLPSPAQSRATLGLAGCRVITLLGFIHPRKGYELLLDAVARLPADVRVILAGGVPAGGERFLHRLQQRIDAGGLARRVRLTGYLPEEELERYLAATHLAVCPFETFSASGSLATWISVAKPILASDLPQIAEMNRAEPGAIGVFQPHTAEALAAAIAARLAGCGDADDPAVARLRRQRSLPVVFDQHLVHYRQLARAGPSAAAVAAGGTAARNQQATDTDKQRAVMGRHTDRGRRDPQQILFLPHWHGNPYQDQLAEQLAALGFEILSVDGRFWLTRVLLGRWPDIVHLHWLHFFYRTSQTRWVVSVLCRLGLSVLRLTALRWLGARFVWTVHNLRDHEQRTPKLERLFTAFVVNRADAFIVHCQAAAAALVGQFPQIHPDCVHVIPHGSYGDAYPNQVTRSDARAALGIDRDAFVLLLFGRIRPYKGAADLIAAFLKLDAADAELWIAGSPGDRETVPQVRRLSASCPRITLQAEFVAADRVQIYMNASDAVVFPYRDVLTSGALVLAMSFGRACIAPRLGCIGELLDDDGAFLYDADDADGLLAAIQRAADRRADLPAMGAHNGRRIARWGWQRVAEMTAHVYRGCGRPATGDRRPISPNVPPAGTRP